MDPESNSDPQAIPTDLPPESFWVSTDDEQDWFDRNAFMQRKTSLKLGLNRNFTSFSHRSDVVSMNPKFKQINTNFKPSVFGLPKTGHKSSDGFSQEKKKPTGRFLLRSRSEPGGKSAHGPEPGSPRVSCTGRVGLKSVKGKKTGFSRIFSSLFRTRSVKHRSKEKENGIVH